MASITINFDVAPAPSMEEGAPSSEATVVQQMADVYGDKRVHEVDSDTEQQPEAKVARVQPFRAALLPSEVLAAIVEASEGENLSLQAIDELIGEKSREQVMVSYDALTKPERVEAYGDSKAERAQARSKAVLQCQVHLLKGVRAARAEGLAGQAQAQAGDLSEDEEPAQE
tara:strand:+ start:249 stop:761 length:513 start_codon:yes stop_codon:yes gene_type:complete